MRCNWYLITLIFFVCVGLRASGQAKLPLELVEDVPLPGGAFRFDYQSLDSEGGRLYIAHLGANRLTVFDTKTAGSSRRLRTWHPFTVSSPFRNSTAFSRRRYPRCRSEVAPATRQYDPESNHGPLCPSH